VSTKPPYKGHRLHAVRVPDEIWEAAKTTANARDENLSEVVRDALVRYTERAARAARRERVRQLRTGAVIAEPTTTQEN
jgi:Arc/MetJ-type ribon-helix-helix transcriptional regulator